MDASYVSDAVSHDIGKTLGRWREANSLKPSAASTDWRWANWSGIRSIGDETPRRLAPAMGMLD